MYMYENENLMLFWRETLFFSMRGPRAQLARKKGPSVAASLRLRYPPDFFLSACARSPRNMIKKTHDLLRSLRSLRNPRC